MSLIDKDAVRSKISSLISKSIADIKDMEGMTQPISPENSIGRVSRMDAINNKSVMEAALANKKEKLSKLKLALNNIESENYGICSMCGNDIQEGRLIFLPESTRCIRCADR